MPENQKIAVEELDAHDAAGRARAHDASAVATSGSPSFLLRALMQVGLISRRNGSAVGRQVQEAPNVHSFPIGRVHRSRKPPNLYFATFLLFVALPSIICSIYLIFIASDQYVAEARFAVQSARFGLSSSDKDKANGLTSSAGSISLPSLAGTDSYIITNYIHSRAILDDLAGKIDVQAIFRRSEADFWAILGRHPKAEKLLDYWNGMISTSIDGPSGIVTLRVRAFRPDDARRLSQAILDASEKLANTVSERARLHTMAEAQSEVDRSAGLVSIALRDEEVFRDQQGFIDPISAATSTSKLLLDAMAQKIRLENEYFVSERSTSADSPSARNLKLQLDVLNDQIDKLKSELTSDSPLNKTVSAALGKFEELELKRLFAEKLYGVAQDALERARIIAQEQAIFISTFVPPDLPEYAEFPQRYAFSLLIPIGLATIWGIFALIAAAVEDHRF